MVKNNKELAQAIEKALQELSGDVSVRNAYMEKRDRVIFKDGLFDGLIFPNGHDKTMYNWGPRIIHVFASQLFGRGIQLYSSYDKEDDSLSPDPAEQKLAEIRNQKRKADAFARKRLVDAMIRDNGGSAMFYRGATIGSAYGHTVLKEWYDPKTKRTNIKVLEDVQKYYAGWSSDDFRTRDFDAFAYQISPTSALREYGDKFERGPDGEPIIEYSQFGAPFLIPATNTKLLIVNAQAPEAPEQRQMVTVIDFTGYLPGWGVKNRKVQQVPKGSETKLSILICGGHVCQQITEEELMPDYYPVANIERPRRPWGESDLSDSAIDINRTYIERMSDWVTFYNKFLFPMYLGRNYDQGEIPKKKQRSTTVVPAGVDQSLELVNAPLNNGYEMPRVLEELKEEFVRITGVSRVMFDDPSISANSNQALMTTLKGIVDIVEAKQKLWEDALVRLFERALEKAAKYDKNISSLIDAEEAWHLYVQWPSILRKEDASYQQILLNLYNAQAISHDTYLELSLGGDVAEEQDRLRDNMKDPVLGGSITKQLPALYQQQLAQAAQALAMPQPGATATEQPLPVLTADQNGEGQTASMPGSGAPAVSPQGAINMANQNAGY
jgi:hypothetical protein